MNRVPQPVACDRPHVKLIPSRTHLNRHHGFNFSREKRSTFQKMTDHKPNPNQET